MINQLRLHRQVVFVLLEGAGAPLRQQPWRLANPVVVVDGDDEARVSVIRAGPVGELLDFISAQLPLATLAPYETRAPVSGSRFFGRDYEISKILANPDTNFVILGIRRIGKTSLLHEIWRQARRETAGADLLEADDRENDRSLSGLQ